MLGTKLGIVPKASDYYVQSMAPPGDVSMPRAAIESILRKKNMQNFQKESGLYWLETCFCHSSVNGLVASGWPVEVKTPTGTAIRPPDALTCWLNDPENYLYLKSVRDLNPNDYLGNEVPQWGAAAIQRLFGAPASFSWLHNFEQVATHVSAGNAVVFGITKPTHFECFIAYDEKARHLIYVDPAPYRDPTGWWQRRMTKDEYDATVQPFSIMIPSAP